MSYPTRFLRFLHDYSFEIAGASVGIATIAYEKKSQRDDLRVGAVALAAIGAMVATIKFRISDEYLLNRERRDVENNPQLLQFTSAATRSNREIVLRAIAQNGFVLEHATNALRNDRQVVLRAVAQDGRALQYASDELRNDREVVLRAVVQNIFALQYASDELRNDGEVVLGAITVAGFGLQYASDELRNNRELVLRAVGRDASALQYASDELRNDRELVLRAIERRPHAIRHASAELRNDRELVLRAVAQSGPALQHASAELRNDREIVLRAIAQNSRALQHASAELRNNREIVLRTVARNGLTLEYASDELKNDREVVLKAVEQDGLALKYASAELKNDREIVLKALAHNLFALEFASAELRNDRELVLRTLAQNARALQCASAELRSNRDFILRAVAEKGSALEYASADLRNDREVVLKAVEQDGFALAYASAELKNDREVVLRAVEHNEFALDYASAELRNDREFQRLLRAQRNQQEQAEERTVLTPNQILLAEEALVIADGELLVHPLVLQERPEAVLALLAAQPQMPRIRFLTDTLALGDGFDGGGLSNQLMTDLFRYLLDGSQNRLIQIFNEIPFSQDRELLSHLGKVLGRCFLGERIITGRVFPDEYFQFLLNLSRKEGEFSDEELIEASQCLIEKDASMRRLLDIYRSDSILNEELEPFGLFDLEQDIRPQMGKYLADLYRKPALAATEILRSLFSIVSRDVFQRTAVVEMSRRIQGAPFDRQQIAQRIRYAENPPHGVVQAKVTWLKEHILDPNTPQKWVEDFLCAVTGRKALTPATTIQIVGQGAMCVAHTCSSQLDLPRDHVPTGIALDDRTKFFNNLDLLLLSTGFQFD